MIADSAPGCAFSDATWRVMVNNLLHCRLQASICIWLIMCKYDVFRKTGSTLHIALSSQEDQATAAGNMHRKFREVWIHGFLRCKQTDRPTCRDEDCNTSHICWGRTKNNTNRQPGGFYKSLLFKF